MLAVARRTTDEQLRPRLVWVLAATPTCAIGKLAGYRRDRQAMPLWQQPSPWSPAQRGALEEWLDTTMTAMCGTDPDTQRLYAEALVAAGYEVREVTHVYQEELSLEQVLGGVYSALSPDDLHAGSREVFAEHVTRSLQATESFIEVVPVTALIGITR